MIRAIAILLLMAVQANSAEFLIRAKDNTIITNATTVRQQRFNEAQIKKGDIIAIRPDGWKWGKKECLPDYIIVKVPNLSTALVTQYQAAKYDITKSTDVYVLRKRNYHVPIAFVDNAISEGGVVTYQRNKINKEATMIRKLQ